VRESRKSDRYLTLRTGKISAVEAPSDIACAVLNVSGTGACILVPTGAVIPEHFELTIDHEDAIRSCRRVWHDGSRIGAEFVSTSVVKKL
jgi:hypothetical protein